MSLLAYTEMGDRLAMRSMNQTRLWAAYSPLLQPCVWLGLVCWLFVICASYPWVLAAKLPHKSLLTPMEAAPNLTPSLETLDEYTTGCWSENVVWTRSDKMCVVKKDVNTWVNSYVDFRVANKQQYFLDKQHICKIHHQFSPPKICSWCTQTIWKIHHKFSRLNLDLMPIMCWNDKTQS